MNILANDGLETTAIEQLEMLGHQVYTEKISQENLSDFCNSNGIKILIVRSATKVTAPIIEQFETVQLIIRAGVGIDNINQDAAKSKNITVCNTPKSSSNAVAELVFAHVLNLARKISYVDNGLKNNGDFKILKNASSDCFELKGKKIGIVGFGRIGQSVAQIALGFGMEVIAHDPLRKTIVLPITIAQQNINVEIPSVSFNAIITQSDIITFHIPFNANGSPLINELIFKQFKPNVILVNTARGGIIDETLLIKALQEQQILGACLDTFINEPLLNTELLKEPMVSLSPHTGGSTKEAQIAIGQEIVDIVANFK